MGARVAQSEKQDGSDSSFLNPGQETPQIQPRTLVEGRTTDFAPQEGQAVGYFSDPQHEGDGVTLRLPWTLE